MHKALALTVMIVLAAPVVDGAQRRRRPTQRRPRAAQPAPAPAAAAVERERREAADRVAEQITTMSRFLYLLGRAVKTIEDADRALAGQQQPSASDVQATERNKAGVRDSIRNVRVGLDKLENDFGTKSSLRPYYSHMVGVANAAATAEQRAQANQFDQAGRSLLEAVNQLAETLAAMQRAAP